MKIYSASLESSRVLGVVPSRFPARPAKTFEPLESRRLMSGWTTVEDYNPDGGAIFFDIASDSSGNLYVAGMEAGHAIVRQQLAGSSTWSTIYSSPDTGQRLSELAVNAAGDVYAAGHAANGGATVLRRAAGQSAFATIYTGPAGEINDLAIDSAGNVFTVGQVYVTTSTKKSSTTVTHWVVRKQTSGQGAFATVDQFLYSAGAASFASGISIVESGPSAGVYVIGDGFTSTTAKGATTTTNTAVLRKSTNGGSTWTTANTFRHQGVENSTGEAITVDGGGNVYVSGRSYDALLTRKSTNGGSSFAIVDSMPLPLNVVFAYAMAADHSDSVYVVGLMTEPGSAANTRFPHAFIRSNVGGSWSTVDDFFQPGANGGGGTYFHGVTVDPAGNVYVAGMSSDGNTRAIVRTNAPPAAASFATLATFSTSTITFGTDERRLAEEIVA